MNATIQTRTNGKPKHTPGPWKTGGRNGIIIYGPSGYAVADAMVFHTKHQAGETEGNANLIAAAPELFAACKALLRLHYDEGKPSAKGLEVIHMARDAIRKAANDQRP